ncbi:hypothetical protein [Paludibaculum fermentans]|uniref:VCBS repeat-containing protein n=1 Tax=Paludibaculum fermentans TaxID=1473598 RepID=A0A7S7SHU3_PALFE|nr:hypothetical protein [Paludibaculum fermentans]QOY85344.1 hypothetical protein IRI77_21215 [Paludibaculum fermentans]
MSIRALRSALVVMLSFAAAWGNWNDTSTGIDLNKLPRFPLTRVRSGRLDAGKHIVFDGISASSKRDERAILLRGVSKRGKAWEVHIHALDEVWKGDLDGNGVQDYVLFASGPAFNGRTTPLFSLSILLMDDQGLPVPFFTLVYKGEDGMGIKHLVDLDHDGRAELLTSWYDEAASDPMVSVFCSGHWVTQLYRFRNLRAEEVRGEMAGLTFPFVHNWSYRGTQCAIEPKPYMAVKAPKVYDHGTALGGEVGTEIVGRQEEWIEIRPAAGCQRINSSVVVYDRPNKRVIAIENLWNPAKEHLEDAILRDGVPVRLSGLDDRQHDGHCFVNLLWAESATSR